MSVWVIELSHNHHTVWETYVKVMSHALQKPVAGILTKYNWRIISNDVSYQELSHVLVLGKTTDRCFRCSEKKLLFFIQTLYENTVMNLSSLRFVEIKKGDIVVFPTLDAHINPHANVLLKIIDAYRSKGAFIIGTIHNTDLYGAKGYDYVPGKELNSWHNKYRWYLWRRWMKNFAWSDKLDLLVTCSDLSIPYDMRDKHIVIPSRLAEDVQDWYFEDIFRVVVTGSMSESRLNWEYIYFLMESLKGLSKIEFVFLGKMPRDKYELLKTKYNGKVVAFNEFVNENTFKKMLKKSHLIIAPLLDTRYGVYTISGSIEADALSYGIPAIVPHFYKSIPEHLLFSRFKTKEELLSGVKKAYNMWIQDTYSSYRNKVVKENKKYSIDSLSKRIRRKVGELYENSHHLSRR